MSGHRLGFHAPEATEAETSAGLTAAILFLRRAGLTPEEAKRGADARTTWGDSGLAPLQEPTAEELVLAEAWDGALESALMACYRGRNAPLEADLYLRE